MAPSDRQTVVGVKGACVARFGADQFFEPLPPVPWICEGVELAPGAPTMLGGYGFSGKTVCAQDLALAVASGGKAWGLFPTKLGRVVHFDYEQGERLTRQRYQRLARARGLGRAELGNRLEVIAFPADYIDADNTKQTEEWLVAETEGATLAIIDSFRAAAPHQEENSSAVRKPLDLLGRVSGRTGCAFLVIHHARKPSDGDAGSTSRYTLRGSGAIFDACQTVWVAAGAVPLKVSDDGERVLQKAQPPQMSIEKARITGKTYDTTMVFAIKDIEIEGDPLAGLAFTVEVPEEQLPLTDRIVCMLQDTKEPLSASKLKTNLGRSHNDIQKAIERLGPRLLQTPKGNHFVYSIAQQSEQALAA